jgi:flagellar protein FlaJ
MRLLSSAGSEGSVGGNRLTLATAFYPLYERVFDEEGTFVADIEEKLAESRMTDPVEMYLSRALGVGMLAGLFLWLFGTTLGYVLFANGIIEIGVLLGVPVQDPTLLALIDAAKVFVAILVTGLLFGSVAFSFGFGTFVVLLYLRSSGRKREINMLLPDAVSFMYALSVGGLNQVEIIRAMALAEDTYGEVSKDFQSIIQETEYFDTDYRTAIRKQAARTPSTELSQFLTDMLSIINSGGDMERFLDDKKEKHMRTAKQQQESILETLELFGEMYMTVSLFPLLLIVILVIMSLLGNASRWMLFLTVYGLIPVIGAMFLILVAGVKWDEPGDGYLTVEDDEGDAHERTGRGVLQFGVVESFVGNYRIFDRIRNREILYETVEFLSKPHHFFRDHPAATLAITVPSTVGVLVAAVLTGVAPTSWQGLVDRPLWGTFVLVYVPIYVTAVPYAVFRLWSVRSRNAVLYNLSDDLRKLSSANDTGLTLLESIRLVGETSAGKLADEFEQMYAKVNYGMSLKQALISFNNKYHIPRLARTVRLIAKSQEASNHITAVLRTAAQASENQDDIDRERRSRTRMQVVIIVMTYLTLLAVIAVLKTQFIDTMSRLAQDTATSGAQGFNIAAIEVNLLSLLFFHAVTIQAIVSGLISGYIRESYITAGLKYVIVLMTIALLVWMVVG